MSVTYEPCGADVRELIKATMDTHHASLSEAGVTIHALFADSFDKDGTSLPAVKVHGIPAAAKISVTSLQDRARGISDAKLVIDREFWDRSAEARQLALLDHELTHLQLRFNEDGLKRDDLGRPCMKLRHHDWELTGFAAVVERHGEASVEAQQFARFQEEYGQLLLFDAETLRNLGAKAVAKFRDKMSQSGIDRVSVELPNGEKTTLYEREA